MHQEALLILWFPCGRWEKNTIKHINETEIQIKENSWGARTQKAGNSMQISSCPTTLIPYLYFEQRGSIYVVWYFPLLSSEGNPRGSPEESNAPASTSMRLILLTWGRSLAHLFLQCDTVSMCPYIRCV